MSDTKKNVEVEAYSSFDYSNAEKILEVKHLKQFFKMGRHLYTKAVNDVSFDVYKGEVFGLVGESGCGKTTTGRSIIKLYQITSGDVVFNGVRIAAGTRWNEKEIKFTNIRLNKKLKELRKQLADKKAEIAKSLKLQISEARELAHSENENEYKDIVTLLDNANEKQQYLPADLKPRKDEYFNYRNIIDSMTVKKANSYVDDTNSAVAKFAKTFIEVSQKLDKEFTFYKIQIEEEKRNAIVNANKICSEQRRKIRQAHIDNDHCDRNFALEEVEKVKEKYADVIAKHEANANASTDESSNENTCLIDQIFEGISCKAVYLYDKVFKMPEANRDAIALSEDDKVYNDYLAELKKAKNSRITSKIQMIFQDPIASLNPRMNVGEIIAEGPKITGIYSKDETKERVAEMLERVGLLKEHMTRYPHEFSGGQRQRIGIARALIMNPELIIADEPVSALDVSIQAQVINLLNDIRHEYGLTILFIAHNLSVVKYFCDRIAVMYYGKLVELATSEELFKHPLHPYTVSLLSAVPSPDPNSEKGRTRIKYNPREAHNYKGIKPTLREIVPGHFVLCSDEEEAKYLEAMKNA